MRWSSSFPGAEVFNREIRIDLRPVKRLLRERPEAVVLGLGALLRVVTYLLDRSMWLDELSLANNLVDKPVFDFSTHLEHDQLAPIGFLIIQRAIASVLGGSSFALRLLPLAAGIGALYLFYLLAPRILPRRAALVALVLFAFSDDLIYYSSEMKPYSLDLAVGLMVTLLAVDALGQQAAIRPVFRLALLAVAAPWFSFASAFVIAGCGTTLLLDALLSGRVRTALVWLMIGFLWLASFLTCYRASYALLNPATTMYVFWDFAFLPLQPPIGAEGLWKTGGLLLEIFVNPLNLASSTHPVVGVILPVSLLTIGTASLSRRSFRVFLLLVMPIGLAAVASVSKRYPLHGRLILELVPTFFLLIANGTEYVARRLLREKLPMYLAMLALLLTHPLWSACHNSMSRRDRYFNAHGDLHPNAFIDRRGPMSDG